MKKIFILLLTALLLSGCGAQQPAPVPETTVPETTAPETTAPETTEPETAESEADEEEKDYYRFSFTAEDRDGRIWTQEDFADYKAVMINFWEPWCGPCVGEMPDLEKLYQNYKDQGFLILGVYSTLEPEEDVLEVLNSTGVSYPILKYSDDFDILQTGYVPTTVFFDSEGHVLNEPFSSALPYEDWAEIVELLV